MGWGCERRISKDYCDMLALSPTECCQLSIVALAAGMVVRSENGVASVRRFGDRSWLAKVV